MANKVLVTAALTYANGPAHLGHLLEAIQTDVYARARKMSGDEVIFMWADDTHGTPIQVRARREGIEPEALIARAYEEHLATYRGFGVGFDIFYTTHSEENRKHAGAIFAALRARGDVEVRDVEQLYSEVDQMFLPDRLVKGTCPVCKTPDQYGDSCEACGSTYRPTELIEPYSTVSGDKPVLRTSEHLFVGLGRHEDFLREWLAPTDEGGRTILQDSVRKFVLDWVDKGLRDWDISREAPYFGIEIPGFPGKYFYVWFDAPIGYIAATDKWCQDNGQDVDSWWKAPAGRGDGEVEIVHVIGKDIVYFHCLFWPAMLHASGYTVPSRVQVHGWLKVNGEKMSKSRGTFILGKTFLEHVDPAYLRYYLAARLSNNQDDFDLGMDDFVNRVNADLVNKAANVASRSVKALAKLGGTLGALPEDAGELVAACTARLAEVPGLYANFESAQALRLAMEMAEDTNGYLNERAPWKLTKTEPELARSILSVGVYVSKLIAAVLKPVLPAWAEKVEALLKLDAPLTWANAAAPLPAGLELGEYQNLAVRLDPKQLDALIEASKQDVAADAALDGGGEGEAESFDYEVEALADEVGIEALDGVDLRVGKIVECEGVPKAKKLLRLTVDLGPLGRRNVFSGIAKSYAPEQLVGKHVVVFANLKPRKMRFGLSEGMIMAAGASDDAVTLLELDPRSLPGDKIS
ncbi:methionine--tRNA ligase [Pseudenhygromyxa sp. WMMC2535]|uniref:methionine--tRNA ligase n=1 Tax=Pseudenhygromyxa sp. WMMC2535 TaxID=2712867 RepID=UPI001554507E|nr:methionine--tRNA ligase [Pseudenhygromyxa sp. WMMC2535]NVB36702.1 methionine--tRNA ligase [Pseudenhygromyxa sp. WMMC2535]